MSVVKKVALNALHLKYGAVMVPFADHLLPLSYESQGLVSSHLWTRTNASLFDVSHMLQSSFKGPDVVKFLESICVSDIKEIQEGHSVLTVMTAENGGVRDDMVVNRRKSNEFYVVSNAGCATTDLLHFRAKMQGFNVSMETIHRSLIALQGPKAVSVVEKISGTSMADMPFMSAKDITLDGAKCLVSRCGYTGEDGVEISVAHSDVEQLVESLIKYDDVRLAGLAVRDSLRLEAGLCLYGHDLDLSTTPMEAGLGWTIGKRRKEEGGFEGFEVIQKQFGNKAPRRRIGLVVEGATAREGAKVFDLEGKEVGVVTSGCPAPSLKVNVAMGYIKAGLHKKGSQVQVMVRNKLRNAVVTSMPFVKASYYKI